MKAYNVATAYCSVYKYVEMQGGAVDNDAPSQLQGSILKWDYWLCRAALIFRMSVQVSTLNGFSGFLWTTFRLTTF